MLLLLLPLLYRPAKCSVRARTSLMHGMCHTHPVTAHHSASVQRLQLLLLKLHLMLLMTLHHLLL